MNDIEKDLLEIHRIKGFTCPFCKVQCELTKDTENELNWICPSCKEVMKIIVE